MKAIKFLVAFILLYFIFTANTFAVSLSISGVPASVDQSQEFQINVSLTCSGCSDSYLRGVFYPSGISYFGYTQDNNGNWSNAPGGSCTTFFKVSQSDLQTGSWSGTIKFKPDKDSSYYNGPGEYSFKVGRYSYTSSCGSSPTWSDEKIIAITGPTPSPTQVPISTPTNTQTPTPTLTNTPTLTPTPTKKPTKTPYPTIADTSSVSAVLGQSTNSSSNNPKESNNLEIASASENILPKIFIGLGVIFLIACAVIISYPYILKFKEEKFGNDK